MAGFVSVNGETTSVFEDCLFGLVTGVGGRAVRVDVADTKVRMEHPVDHLPFELPKVGIPGLRPAAVLEDLLDDWQVDLFERFLVC